MDEELWNQRMLLRQQQTLPPHAITPCPIDCYYRQLFKRTEEEENDEVMQCSSREVDTCD